MNEKDIVRFQCHSKVILVKYKTKMNYFEPSNVQNKSSLILNIIFKNTQMLQLFAVNIKTEIMNKNYCWTAKQYGLGLLGSGWTSTPFNILGSTD